MHAMYLLSKVTGVKNVLLKQPLTRSRKRETLYTQPFEPVNFGTRKILLA
jgi:hypothetical protein